MPDDKPIFFFRSPSEYGPLTQDEKEVIEWTQNYWPEIPLVGWDGQRIGTNVEEEDTKYSANSISLWRSILQRQYSLVILPREGLLWRMLLSLTTARKRMVVQPGGIMYTFSFSKLAVNQVARFEFLLLVLLLPVTLLPSIPLALYLFVRFVKTGRMKSLLRTVRMQ